MKICQSLFLKENKSWDFSWWGMQYRHNQSSSTVLLLKTFLNPKLYRYCLWVKHFSYSSKMKFPLNEENLHFSSKPLCYQWIHSVYILQQEFHYTIRGSAMMQYKMDCFGEWTWLCHQLHSQLWAGRNRFEPLGTGLNRFKPVWTSRNQSEPVGTDWNRFELVGTGWNRFKIVTNIIKILIYVKLHIWPLP